MRRSRRRALTWALVAMGIAMVALGGVLVATFPWSEAGVPFAHTGFFHGPRFFGGGLSIPLIALRLVGAAFIVLLIMRIAAAVRGRSNGALETASRRFAAGEITEEQFRRIRDVLDS